MNKILLDTTAYSKLLAGAREVLDILTKAEVVCMSTIVLGELYAGFYGGSRRNENENLLERFLEKPSVTTLAVSHETARIFGEVKENLTRKGTPIPINDVWIAAHAFESGSLLVTFDGHFSKVPGLRCW